MRPLERGHLADGENIQVRPNDLVSVDEGDFVEVNGEKDVQEENLVAPNGVLLLALRPEPRRPFVSDEFVLEAIILRKVRDEFLGHKCQYPLT